MQEKFKLIGNRYNLRRNITVEIDRLVRKNMVKI